jgi:glyoxylase-like metal-dependent hydrolase (beta-lactamase superfamily II)
MKSPAALVLFLAATPLLAQRDFSATKIEVQNISGPVYMLTGAGGNIGFSSGDDGIVIIDDQFAPLAPRLQEAIEKVAKQPFRFILNTHFHGDHTGSNAHFAQLAPIVAHSNVRKRLEGQLGDAESGVTPKSLPMVTYEDGVSIFMNGEEVRVIHMPPGHTDSDSIVWFTKSNVVHMGDDFFQGHFPYIDLESGGRVDGMIAAIDRVVSLVPANTKVIPGHGALSDVPALKAYATMLRETSAIVRKGLRAGKSAQQLKDEKALAAYDAFSWEFVSSDGFIDTLVKDAGTKVKTKS